MSSALQLRQRKVMSTCGSEAQRKMGLEHLARDVYAVHDANAFFAIATHQCDLSRRLTHCRDCPVH